MLQSCLCLPSLHLHIYNLFYLLLNKHFFKHTYNVYSSNFYLNYIFYTTIISCHFLCNLPGSNCIIIVPGANNEMTKEDVESAEELIKSCKVLVCQNEIPQDISIAAMKIAIENKGNI